MRLHFSFGGSRSNSRSCVSIIHVNHAQVCTPLLIVFVGEKVINLPTHDGQRLWCFLSLTRAENRFLGSPFLGSLSSVGLFYLRGLLFLSFFPSSLSSDGVTSHTLANHCGNLIYTCLPCGGKVLILRFIQKRMRTFRHM